jgi:hypothetical protein
LVLDDLPKGVNMNSKYFYGIALKEIRRAVIAIAIKSKIDEVMAGWIILKFAIPRRPRQDWKNFTSLDCSIRHLLSMFHFAISGFSAGARM